MELGDDDEGYLLSPFEDEDPPVAAASNPLVDVDEEVPVPVPPSA